MNSWSAAGYLPKFKYGDTLLFASVSAFILGLYKSGARTIAKTERKGENVDAKEARKDIIFTLVG